MKLVNFDFLNREGCVAVRPYKFVTDRDFWKEVKLSRRKRKKRVNKVFVSRGGIRL